MHTVVIREGAHSSPSFFSFDSERAARKALPALKRGCRVGAGTWALYGYDPRVEEGPPAIASGTRR